MNEKRDRANEGFYLDKNLGTNRILGSNKGLALAALAVVMLLIAALSAGCSSSKQPESASVRTEPAVDGQFTQNSGAASFGSADVGKMPALTSESKADTSIASSDNASSAAAAPNEGKRAASTNSAAGTGEAADGFAETPGEGGGGFALADGSKLSPEALERKLIYHANMTMEVKDYARTQSEIRDMATLAGGYVLQFGDNQSMHELGEPLR
ncbi:DUF4349 domain-containing protein [Ferviditalea candida]|uniref:DUF4349 domain-containing protein n=1 Tax=Ferviditalea candida TaxID=3108399 RepID=A0ABU5ZH65_9BACL|nr:DUF4349 domain-containing protein [Paenibacillaceae bacterium T2]